MSAPTGRVLTLLELLQSGGTRTMAELADRLGVEGRTVRRYVGQLIDLGIPVESVRGRYGGYRLARGYRLPPLMLDDDEALAVLLGLMARRPVADTASETAAAKIRRVLPGRLASRLEALLESVAFTERPGGPDVPDGGVLLAVADAVRHRRPVVIRYTDRGGRRSERTLHPYGIVSHAGRWYVTGEDPGVGESRTFRLDRVEDARALPGSFEAPAGVDPARRVVEGFAAAAYRYEVSLRVQGTVEQVRARLPAGIATVAEIPGGGDAAGGEAAGEGWLRVELRAERLDWLPGVLAALDRPFVIERPGELRDLVLAFAGRLAARARGSAGDEAAVGDAPPPQDRPLAVADAVQHEGDHRAGEEASHDEAHGEHECDGHQKFPPSEVQT
ncbi:YafY family transcriptional regulator [Nonomuraea sp. FMUSA5-5]|uniref:YafY family transcriptional regulator n=1 Tax=Nonomuraea composti TaxID=2720023 RepID=A0ABX1B569_9ACTN|nr:YafY family protein [Nonomuraea sp. FMUSA5-5]NJP92985.1 YafY family transcriptional regulator [Nonomuraea sp. FMUSA5-5]